MAAVYGTGRHRWDISDQDARTALMVGAHSTSGPIEANKNSSGTCANSSMFWRTACSNLLLASSTFVLRFNAGIFLPLSCLWPELSSLVSYTFSWSCYSVFLVGRTPFFVSVHGRANQDQSMFSGTRIQPQVIAFQRDPPWAYHMRLLPSTLLPIGLLEPCHSSLFGISR